MTGRRQSKFACPFVAGGDEVGRGPLAGPVVAAAVIMPARGLPRGLTDSKALSETERAELNVKFRQRALAFCIAEADVSIGNSDAVVMRPSCRATFPAAGQRRLNAAWKMRRILHIAGRGPLAAPPPAPISPSGKRRHG